jgi:hypothetical protein
LKPVTTPRPSGLRSSMRSVARCRCPCKEGPQRVLGSLAPLRNHRALGRRPRASHAPLRSARLGGDARSRNRPPRRSRWGGNRAQVSLPGFTPGKQLVEQEPLEPGSCGERSLEQRGVVDIRAVQAQGRVAEIECCTSSKVNRGLSSTRTSGCRRARSSSATESGVRKLRSAAPQKD